MVLTQVDWRLWAVAAGVLLMVLVAAMRFRPWRLITGATDADARVSRETLAAIATAIAGVFGAIGVRHEIGDTWASVGGALIVIVSALWGTSAERARRRERERVSKDTVKASGPLLKGSVERFEILDWDSLSEPQFDELDAEMRARTTRSRVTTIEDVLTFGDGPRSWFLAWVTMEKCSREPSKANAWRFTVKRMDGIKVQCLPFAKRWGPPPSWERIEWHALEEMQSIFLRNACLYNVFLHVECPALPEDIDIATFEVQVTDDNGAEVVCVMESRPAVARPGPYAALQTEIIGACDELLGFVATEAIDHPGNALPEFKPGQVVDEATRAEYQRLLEKGRVAGVRRRLEYERCFGARIRAYVARLKEPPHLLRDKTLDGYLALNPSVEDVGHMQTIATRLKALALRLSDSPPSTDALILRRDRTGVQHKAKAIYDRVEGTIYKLKMPVRDHDIRARIGSSDPAEVENIARAGEDIDRRKRLAEAQFHEIWYLEIDGLLSDFEDFGVSTDEIRRLAPNGWAAFENIQRVADEIMSMRAELDQ